MRPIWKGALSFGLVNIPVRLFIAARSRSTGFRLLHRPCHTPIRYRRWCPACEQDVSPEDIDRGVAANGEGFVVVSDEDLSSLPLPTAHAIQILDFVSLAEIDPLYFDRSYHVLPAEGAGRAYGLLREAMARSNRAAVAKVLLRTAEALATVRTFGGDRLVMHTMYYQSELREVADAPTLAAGPVDSRELEMATALIDNLTVSFDASRYHSDYRAALDRLIAERLAGRELVTAEPERAPVIDLLAALRESVRHSEQARAAR